MKNYIEAFGPPGVGKSYVAARLLQLPVSQRGTVHVEAFPMASRGRLLRVLAKLLLTLRYLPLFVANGGKMLRLIRRTHWLSRVSAARALINWVQLVAMIHYLHRRDGSILLSQGIFQAIWSLRFRAHNEAESPFPMQGWISFTLSLLPPRDIVVLYVSASEQVTQARLASREKGQSVMDRQKGDATLQVLSEHIVHELLGALEVLAEQGMLRIVHFDNSSDAISDERLLALANELTLGNRAGI